MGDGKETEVMSNKYTVASSGPIPGLGGINGPLTTPTPMAFNDVLYMVRKGYVVFEHNPFDISEKVRVTIDNIRNIRFKSSAAVAISRRNLNKQLQEMDSPKKVTMTTGKNNETTKTVIVETKNKNTKGETVTEKVAKVEEHKNTKATEVPVTSPDGFKK